MSREPAVERGRIREYLLQKSRRRRAGPLRGVVLRRRRPPRPRRGRGRPPRLRLCSRTPHGCRPPPLREGPPRHSVLSREGRDDDSPPTQDRPRPGIAAARSRDVRRVWRWPLPGSNRDRRCVRPPRRPSPRFARHGPSTEAAALCAALGAERLHAARRDDGSGRRRAGDAVRGAAGADGRGHRGPARGASPGLPSGSRLSPLSRSRPTPGTGASSFAPNPARSCGTAVTSRSQREPPRTWRSGSPRECPRRDRSASPCGPTALQPSPPSSRSPRRLRVRRVR